MEKYKLPWLILNFPFKKTLRLSSQFIPAICLFLWGCGTGKDYYHLSTFVTDKTINAVVEIPGGTNKKFEYDQNLGNFVIDKKNNVERVIDFLPYPANYGFIPSTHSNADEGGDGDALDILVLSEALKTGTVIETVPIAVLKLIDDGEEDYKIIAVPAKEELRIINALTYNELSLNYPGLVSILETWFLNYNKTDPATVKGWGNENEALMEIKKHLKNN